MPGTVPVTSTYALNNATIPFVIDLANLGWKGFADKSEHHARGIAVSQGQIINQELRIEMGLTP